MAAPIAVVVPLVVSDDMVCILDALANPVVATPCLDWTPMPAVAGGNPQVSIPTFQMVRAFSRRCGLGPLPIDLQVARNSSMLQLGFDGAFWSRVLTELDTCGLFAVPFAQTRDLDAALSSLVIQNPQQLLLGGADWLAMLPPFNPPIPVAPVAPAGRGRGRGAGRGGAAVGVPLPLGLPPAGPADLRFLSVTRIDRLISANSNEPFKTIARLAGFLGPCLSQNVRADEMSTVRTSAAILRPNLAKFAGLDGSIGPAGDPALAARLGDFIDGAYNALTSWLAPPRNTELELQLEGFAAFRYLLGRPADKAAVEAGRLAFVNDKCAPASSNPTN